MGKRIPKSIQEKAIAKWLEGKPRDLIARELRISGGSVTGIIKGRRKKERQFDLLRVVAVRLRDIGVDVESFAHLLRLRELIELEYSDCGKSIEEKEEAIESLMETLSVFCFNQKCTVPEFGNMVHTIYHAADKFGIALYDLPTYVSELAGMATAIEKEIDLLRNKEERLLKHYQITRDVIKDILGRGPYMLGAYYDMKARLQEAINERNQYKTEIFNLKIELKAREIEMARKADKVGIPQM